MNTKIDTKKKGMLNRVSKAKGGGSVVPKITGSTLKGDSYLAAETQSMENARRKIEQQGERQLARVHALEHPDEPVQGNEEGYENTMLEHPELDSQRLDGVDNTVIPQLTDRDARREYDNEKNKQQAEKQLKLGLAFQPKPSSAPRPM